MFTLSGRLKLCKLRFRQGSPARFDSTTPAEQAMQPIPPTTGRFRWEFSYQKPNKMSSRRLLSAESSLRRFFHEPKALVWRANVAIRPL